MDGDQVQKRNGDNETILNRDYEMVNIIVTMTTNLMVVVANGTHYGDDMNSWEQIAKAGKHQATRRRLNQNEYCQIIHC